MQARRRDPDSTRIGVGALGDASPMSDDERIAQEEILSGIRKLLTADFLAQCVRRPDDKRWFLALVESARDRILTNAGRLKKR